jgi:C-22 sterol desaturase
LCDPAPPISRSRTLFHGPTMALNASFVSPTADAKVAHLMSQFDNNSLLSVVFSGFSVWRLLLTLVVVAVAYDQCA